MLCGWWWGREVEEREEVVHRFGIALLASAVQSWREGLPEVSCFCSFLDRGNLGPLHPTLKGVLAFVYSAQLEGRSWLSSRSQYNFNHVHGILPLSSLHDLRLPQADNWGHSGFALSMPLEWMWGSCHWWLVPAGAHFTLIRVSLCLGKAQELSAPVAARQVLLPCSLFVRTKPRGEACLNAEFF